MKTKDAAALMKTLRGCKSFHEAIELLDSDDSVIRNENKDISELSIS